MNEPTLYFDFISPYSHLCVAELEAGKLGGANVRYTPVVYGAILSATGLIGPVENEAKRRYTFLDVLRRAQKMGLPFEGAPAHPFRSLEALRAVCVFADRPEVGRLVSRLSNACWGEGADISDVAVISDIAREVGLNAADLPSRIADPSIKQQLTDHTQRAIEQGIFGVPTFALEGELFWGHDRIEDLADRLSGRPAPSTNHLQKMLGRPRAIDRRR